MSGRYSVNGPPNLVYALDSTSAQFYNTFDKTQNCSIRQISQTHNSTTFVRTQRTSPNDCRDPTRPRTHQCHPLPRDWQSTHHARPSRPRRYKKVIQAMPSPEYGVRVVRSWIAISTTTQHNNYTTAHAHNTKTAVIKPSLLYFAERLHRSQATSDRTRRAHLQ